MNAFDRSLFLWINGAAGHSRVLDALGVLFGQYGIFLFAALMLVLWFALPKSALRDRRILAYGGFSAILGLLGNYAIAHIWYRPRPFVVYPHLVHQLVQHAPDSSFPSDHATAAFAVAAALAGASRGLRRIFWTFAGLIAVARVFIGVHWPTDVIAALGVGALSALVVRRGHRVVDPVIDWALRLLRLAPQVDREA